MLLFEHIYIPNKNGVILTFISTFIKIWFGLVV